MLSYRYTYICPYECSSTYQPAKCVAVATGSSVKTPSWTYILLQPIIVFPLLAGKTLRALALKAAAEASVAASVPPLPARGSQHSAASQSAAWPDAVEQQEEFPQVKVPGRAFVAAGLGRFATLAELDLKDKRATTLTCIAACRGISIHQWASTGE